MADVASGTGEAFNAEARTTEFAGQNVTWDRLIVGAALEVARAQLAVGKIPDVEAKAAAVQENARAHAVASRAWLEQATADLDALAAEHGRTEEEALALVARAVVDLTEGA